MQTFNMLQLNLEGCNLVNGGFHMKKFRLWSKISFVISISQLLLAIFKEIQNYNKSKKHPSKNKRG